MEHRFDLALEYTLPLAGHWVLERDLVPSLDRQKAGIGRQDDHGHVTSDLPAPRRCGEIRKVVVLVSHF